MQLLQTELAHLGIPNFADVRVFGFRQVYNPTLNDPPELRTYVTIENPLGGYSTTHFDGLVQFGVTACSLGFCKK